MDSIDFCPAKIYNDLEIKWTLYPRAYMGNKPWRIKMYASIDVRKYMEVPEMTEREMHSIKMSTLYELRLIFTTGEKQEYTKEEIVELLDKIAMAKEQE